ncbi:glycosyltransferase family 39 protein [Parafilimonas terrae]|uniref:Dolichyl-phosphate-mannose-protein mannosyltransferase n=1 Tax=Parafilimonas terrae TaxID=1465490 RepID=A0A1I5YI64_9BACT|nr:glycosyltransferase family 39 protein [Parafilimonas terrae]SFQ43860.1 Dolichyl-phosphate-mannose-protein mannosyltransferase [Parafilimonas terrae]
MKKNNTLLYTLALLRIIIPYLLQHPVYEPHRDEFLYLAEGHHLAFGFMEVPPMLSIFAWLTNLFGGGMFWVKLWPSLFGAATFIVAGKIIQSLGGKSFALILLFLSFLFGAYLRMFFLFQPNAPEIFFWTLIAFSFIRFVQTEKNKWLYVFGISVGLGMLSKYSVAFYTVSILLALLFTKHRIVFFNKHFWYASLIGFLIFLPNIIWQWQNHFPVIVHMNELQQTQLQYINPAGFLTDQLLLMFPCFFVWLTGLFNALSSKQYRFIGLAYLFVIILLLMGHGKSYYAAGVYPPLFAFGATALEKFTATQRKYLRYAFVIFAVGFGLFVVPILLPVLPPQPLADLYVKMNIAKTGTLKWEDLKDHSLPQDFADMQGWEEMAQKVAKAYHALDDSERQNTVIFCNNYGMAGAINYYARKYNLPEAYSDNASFLYWLPTSLQIENFILVSDDPDEKQHDFAKGFTSVTKTDSITNKFAREKGDYIYVFIGADDNFRKFFKQKIEKDKAEFKY